MCCCCCCSSVGLVGRCSFFLCFRAHPRLSFLCGSYNPAQLSRNHGFGLRGGGSEHHALHAIGNYWVLLGGDDEALQLIYNEQNVFFKRRFSPCDFYLDYDQIN